MEFTLTLIALVATIICASPVDRRADTTSTSTSSSTITPASTPVNYGNYGNYGRYGNYGNYGAFKRAADTDPTTTSSSITTTSTPVSYGDYGNYGNYGQYGSYNHYPRGVENNDVGELVATSGVAKRKESVLSGYVEREVVVEKEADTKENTITEHYSHPSEQLALKSYRVHVPEAEKAGAE